MDDKSPEDRPIISKFLSENNSRKSGFSMVLITLFTSDSLLSSGKATL